MDKAQHTATSAAIVVILAVSLLGTAPGRPASATTRLAECARTVETYFLYGLPGGWEVQTAVADDGGAAWHRTDDPIARGWRYRSDLRGAGAKDDRLVTAPFVGTPTTTVTFTHDFVLPGPARGTLEVSDDDGATWQVVGDDRFLSGGYGDVGVGGGGAGFTGVVADTFVAEPAVSTVDLSHLSGTEIRLAWRLDAPGVTGLSGPGFWALDRAALHGVADVGCVDAGQTHLRCTEVSDPRFTTGLPDGWSVETPTNADGTASWSPSQGALFLWGGVASAATGLGAKDDQLHAPPFLATAASRVAFLHRHVLEPGRDGAVLEYRTVGEDGWTSVEAHRFALGGYDAALADGTPAWSGTSAPTTGQSPLNEAMRTTVVDFGDLAGQQVAIRWRLLQDGARPDSVPGADWLVSSIRFADVILDPGCPPADADVASYCSSLDPPASAGVTGVTDDGRDVRLDVRVAMDVAEGGQIALLAQQSPDEAAARMAALEEEVGGLLAPMRRAYDPLGIEISLTYDLLAPLGADGQPRERPEAPQTGIVDDALSSEPTYADELFALAKDQYDGRRPPGADVVLVVSDHELGGFVAGIADCVGGIAHDDHAFAISTIDRTGEDAPDHSAEVAAHEIGHLLGAHHHFHNCVESAPQWAPALDLSGACTLMSNDVFFTWLTFSTVNGVIVRGHAVDHAAANDG